MKTTNAVSAKATCSNRRRRLNAGPIAVTVVGSYSTDADAIKATELTFENLFHKKFEKELKGRRPDIFSSLLVKNVTSTQKTLRCYDFSAKVEEVEVCNNCTGPEQFQCTAGVCASGYENFHKTRGTCEPVKCNCPNGTSTMGTDCTNKTLCKACKKGYYLVDGKCKQCTQPNHLQATCLACTRHGKCIETKCQPGFYPSWRGSWSLGEASCQEDNYCTPRACGSRENMCFSVATPEEFVCHCAKGFSGGFPHPNKACFKFDACVDPPPPGRKVECGGPSQCLPQPEGNYKCECADGSNAGVIITFTVLLYCLAWFNHSDTIM